MNPQNTTIDRTNATLTALRRILRVTELHGKEVAQTVGMTAVQLRLLKLANETPSANAKMLAAQLRVSQATVTTLLDKLETLGMIFRKVCDTDRRQKLIRLTDKGEDALRDAPDPMQRDFALRFGRLLDWEQSMLLASVERIAALLDAEDIEASPILATGDIIENVDAPTSFGNENETS